jgi:endonuclease-3
MGIAYAITKVIKTMDSSKQILETLMNEYPNAKYYLNFSNPLELMVAAMLSAQIKDEVVNALTPRLFKQYKSAKDYANADLNELTNEIRSVTYAGNKAKYIKKACNILIEKHKGEVPKSLDELVDLPGIGRKTGNTILINAYGIVEGIPCDTHVIRVSYRLGWTKSKNPDIIERDLMNLLPKEYWGKIPYILKALGRNICKAPVPVCSKCPVKNLCPRNGVTDSL